MATDVTAMPPARTNANGHLALSAAARRPKTAAARATPRVTLPSRLRPPAPTPLRSIQGRKEDSATVAMDTMLAAARINTPRKGGGSTRLFGGEAQGVAGGKGDVPTLR